VEKEWVSEPTKNIGNLDALGCTITNCLGILVLLLARNVQTQGGTTAFATYARLPFAQMVLWPFKSRISH
jgi:hypothetical protein